MRTLVLLRHGESVWNQENRFTGWYDCDLSERGEAEARSAGRLLATEAIDVRVAHTSVLTRATRTLVLALEELGRLWVPVRRHWRLNERHYGALQGLDKAETLAKHGEVKFAQWRRSYDVPPPAVTADSEHHPSHDTRYRDVPPDQLPATECLRDVVERLLPYWHDRIAGDLRPAGANAGAAPPPGRAPQPGLLAEAGAPSPAGAVLVVAHGNSLRALVKHLEGISDADISALNIPTGIPLVYHLADDDPCRPLDPADATTGLRGRYLGDPDAVARAAQAVANQGR
jgi:2,3-bisphosphoglycerate-dependent phosphoglycerate mutase